YRGIFENAVEGIYQTTPSGRYLNVNPALARIYGYDSPDDLVNSLTDIAAQLYVDPADRARFTRLMDATDVVEGFEAPIFRRDGRIIWISENARRVRDRDGNILYYEGMVQDVTARKAAEAKIRFQASYDLLTRLPNRYHLMEALGFLLRMAGENGSRVSVLALTLERFKAITETLGHATGDNLLKLAAGRLRGVVRHSDMVAHLGGGEFVIVLPEVLGHKAAICVAEKVMYAFSHPFPVGGGEFYCPPRMGIASFPEDGADTEELLRNAHGAMLHARRGKVRCYEFFREEMNRKQAERLSLETDLRQAVQRGEFTLHYQPKVDAPTGRIVGAEALIRWRHPSLGMVSPALFIPLAEETGLVVPIGEWVLREACRQLQDWRGRGLDIPSVSVNISGVQFKSPTLLQAIDAALADSGLPPDSLDVELTESMMVEDVEAAIAMMTNLRHRGLSVSIDDFGTGYSSLSYLKTLPITTLKIDQAFVRDLPGSIKDGAIVTTIVTLAANLGFDVVAEGVETAEQVAFLAERGCHTIQGYYFSRPLDGEAFSRMATERRSEAA
ncbi:MAG: EAL domain-containing protein, partial [Rhodospirillales bacterium]|nr:EAL domain-containing protein [Rhodospirillales bacterium]